VTFCEQPFDNFEVDEHGNVRTCCSYWMDESIGNIHESSITEILNSDKAKNIRASILDGSFSYCNKKTCPRLQNVDALPKREDVTQERHKHIIENNITDMDRIKHVNFLWDDSCNLKCPSCRISSILHTSGKKYDDAVAIQNSAQKFSGTS
jgi:radical SAM protein with 4Fe4S-binding SPASM domain